MTTQALCAPDENRQLLWILAGLYLVQGLPVGLAFQAFPAMLRYAGASLELVAMVPVAALPWVLKLLWAPLVDNYWSSRVGRRRSWIIPMQILSACVVFVMASVGLNVNSAMPILVLIGVLSVLSSTQDVATDGLAAERLKGKALGKANTLQVSCFMLGMLVGGGLVMIGVEQIGFTFTFVLLGIIQLLCTLPILRWEEPAPCPHDIKVPGNLIKTFKRPFSFVMLMLAMCATMGGAGLFGLTKLILIDAGWSMTDVGFLTGIGSTLMVVLGCIIAAPLMYKQTVWQLQLTGLSVLVFSSVGWGLINHYDLIIPQWVWLLTLSTGLSIGLNTVAAYTLVMQFARAGNQPGVDVAAFQACQALGDTVMGVGAVMLASIMSYGLASLLSLPVAMCCIGLVLFCRYRVALTT